MPKAVYIETFGCQMNVSDSEVVAAILRMHGFTLADTPQRADVVLINTCAIRDNAEQRIWGRIGFYEAFRSAKPIIGILGCMAERLKEELIRTKSTVDLVVGPDAYRQLPTLILHAAEGQKTINTTLSREETYDEILPFRDAAPGISGFVAIMRGCNNMCSFCVVPFTRGRERSRAPQSILREVAELESSGYKEVTLIGQNVDSYHASKGNGETLDFADLLADVAMNHPRLRVRFSTSHPKDINARVLQAIATYPNLCRHIHLPVQAGASSMLERMRRGYTREHYLALIDAIRATLPDCAITTDIIAGFCDETEQEHEATLSLMETVRFDAAFMFKYSERPGTLAARRMKDNVPDELKGKRLEEIIQLQNQHSRIKNSAHLNQSMEVLVEGESKKNSDELCGRTSGNKMVVFPACNARIGELRHVRINGYSSATLRGDLVDQN